MSGKRAVFLDRDGVINRVKVKGDVPQTVKRASDFQFLPGVKRALADLRKARLALVVITNQPDVARGGLSMKAVQEVHDKMNRIFPFDGTYTCPHDDEDRCDCRKPKPGLILRAASENGINPKSSFLVGDRTRDIAAGIAAGCTTLFVRKSYSGQIDADYMVKNLPQAARIILELAGDKR